MAISVLFIGLVSSLLTYSQEEGHGKPSRSMASFSSDLAKNLSFSYNSFYHRNDTSGCLHLGKALESVRLEKNISENTRTKIDIQLKDAKEYCDGDKVSRKQVTDLIRDAVRLVNGREKKDSSPVAEERQQSQADN